MTDDNKFKDYDAIYFLQMDAMCSLLFFNIKTLGLWKTHLIADTNTSRT